MPRPLRPVADGLIYHVINRGNNRQTVFASEGDFKAFLKAIADLKERIRFDLYGYCLMTNHIHLLIRPRQGAISRIVQSLLVLAHTAIPPFSWQQRARLARALQEPADPGRRPPLGGLAVHRGQPAAREDGGACGRLSLEQLRLPWRRARGPVAGRGGRLRGPGRLSGGAATALVRLRRTATGGGGVGRHSPQCRDWSAVRREGVGGSLVRAIEARPDHPAARPASKRCQR